MKKHKKFIIIIVLALVVFVGSMAFISHSFYPCPSPGVMAMRGLTVNLEQSEKTIKEKTINWYENRFCQ